MGRPVTCHANPLMLDQTVNRGHVWESNSKNYVRYIANNICNTILLGK